MIALRLLPSEGDEVYIAIEIRYPDSMATLLARGHVNPLTKEVVLPEQNLVHLPVPKFVNNMSYESLLINKTDIFAFFESNGRNLVDSAYALSYSLKSKFVKSIALPSIEYRITDVTKIENNKFWAINYFSLEIVYHLNLLVIYWLKSLVRVKVILGQKE